MMEHVEVMRRIGIEVLEKKIPRNRGILDDQNVVIVIERIVQPMLLRNRSLFPLSYFVRITF